MKHTIQPSTTNKHLIRWVEKMAALCQPSAIHWLDGSQAEYESLCLQLVSAGTFMRLSNENWPGCFYARSHPNDVARVEDRTFICSLSKENAGPTNNWADPFVMRKTLKDVFRGSMRGRTMYVMPFSMGPIGSPMSQIGVQLTDSAYAVVNMRIMARIGTPVYREIEKGEKRVVPCLHSVGAPLRPGEPDVPWPQNDTKYIVHFPETREIWSYGSGYGGNALLGKKCFALRIASNIARDEGWMAEHMLIVGVESPTHEKTYVAAAFPSARGKTNFAMLIPPSGFEGWKVWTVGDDIAWIKPDDPGQLRAINPESGFFGVAPGTSEKTNPNAMAILRTYYLYQRRARNRARSSQRGYLVGGHDRSPACRSPGLAWPAMDSQIAFTCSSPEWPLHRARRAMPPDRSLMGRPEWGSDLSDFVWRASTCNNAACLPGVQLVLRRLHRRHHETTAAAGGKVGTVRRDPMAMLPFCGYHMGDYFRNWLKMQRELSITPRVFHVNWFRKDTDGKFLWPGYSENMRVLKWIVDRVHGRVRGKETPIGWTPHFNDMEWEGLDFSRQTFDEIQTVDRTAWKREVMDHEELFIALHDHLPSEMVYERELLICRL
jgi:phosphoenolpyruvate carboxykinase (GTP)